MAKKTGSSRSHSSVSAAAIAPAQQERAESTCPTIVGIGASAGGLEAFTELLSHLPDDTGMAFVLIQHLDPKHDSHLTELLSKESKMPVAEVTGETRVEANHIYVIAPRRNLGISGGVLRTPPRPANGCNMPVDAFFRELAADRGSKALGVVLSGTASDGTLGLQAIKAAGGITFAQDVRTAKFDGMPKSAIAAGMADYVLPPAGIALQLVALAREAQVPLESSDDLEPPEDAELARILRLVRSATGVDFTHYKHGTLARRIKRRMTLRGFETLEEYSRDLEQNRDEANALCENCFITVTAFFREPAVFDELKRLVFPALVENRAPEDPIQNLGSRVRLGRRGLFHCHLPDGILRRGESPLSDRDFRDRSERNRHRKSPRRHIRRRRPGAYIAAAPGALLRPIGSRIPGRQGYPRHVRVCQAQPGAGPAFLQAGPDQLLQCADLPGRSYCSGRSGQPCSTPSSRRASWCSALRKVSARFPSHFIKWRRATRFIACGRPRARRRCR